MAQALWREELAGGCHECWLCVGAQGVRTLQSSVCDRLNQLRLEHQHKPASHIRRTPTCHTCSHHKTPFLPAQQGSSPPPAASSSIQVSTPASSHIHGVPTPHPCTRRQPKPFTFPRLPAQQGSPSPPAAASSPQASTPVAQRSATPPQPREAGLPPPPPASSSPSAARRTALPAPPSPYCLPGSCREGAPGTGSCRSNLPRGAPAAGRR